MYDGSHREVYMEKSLYILSGSMSVQDDIEAEDIESVSRHLAVGDGVHAAIAAADILILPK